MPKFFIKKDSISNSKLLLTGADINHIIKVLRKNVGDILEASDGEGCSYRVEITDVFTDKIIANILEKKVEKESNISVTLYQSIPKSDKMDIIIQKCTELGISKIVPFTSLRTVVIIDSKNEDKKLQRWRKIGQEACKQCKRSTIPQISSIYTFEKLLKDIKMHDLCMIAYEKETLSIKKVLKDNSDAKSIAIIVGPEGGFEEQEIEQARSLGAKSVTLGERILRTETAGMATLCIIMYELEDVL